MAWIRLDDTYFYHPKFVLLSDRAFRLWHEGMCYCSKLMTDGLIKATDLKAFRYASPKVIAELTTPRGHTKALWVTDPEGFRIHDYLDWNQGRAEQQQQREATKQRVRAYRSRWRSPPGNDVGNALRNDQCNASVRGQGLLSGSLEKRFGEKPSTSLEPDEVAARAGQLLNLYQELYPKYRNGAKLRLIGNSVEFEEACSLVRTWDLPRLEKLAVLVLVTDDVFISKTDRSFKIFAMKASWADDKLKVWETENGVTA